MLITQGNFIDLLGSEFPEVLAAIDQYQKRLLHPEMGAFRRTVEEAIDSGNLWAAETYFRSVDRVLTEADPDVRNAIEVSFLEDFDLGEFTRTRHDAVRSRMPPALRDILRANASKFRPATRRKQITGDNFR